MIIIGANAIIHKNVSKIGYFGPLLPISKTDN